MKPVACIVVTLGCLAASAPLQEGYGASTPSIDRSTVAEFSAYRSLDLKRFEKPYVVCLRHAVPGVVESALRDVVLIRLAQPGAPCERIQEEVHRLAADGATPVIRYKAALASLVLENPAMFAVDSYLAFTTDADVFRHISKHLECAHLTADG